MNTTKKLYAYLLTVLFLTSLLTGLSPIAGSQAATPSLKLTGADLATDLSQAFGNAAINPVYTNKALDLTPQRDYVIGATATSGGETVTFDLVESGPQTGIFFGSFKATAGSTSQPTADPAFKRTLGDGFLKVASGATITVQMPGTGASSDTIVWVPSSTGVLTQFNSLAHRSATPPVNGNPTIAVIGWAARIYFTVDDVDLNRNSGAAEEYTNKLRVWSDSDPTGDFVTLREAGTNSRFFHADVGFELARVANNGRVFTQDRDQVFAEYLDAGDANGFSRHVQMEPRAGRTFLAAADGVIAFSGATHVGITQLNPTGLDRAVLSVIDLDRDHSVASEEVLVNIHRDGTLLCEDVRLQQLGGALGSYYMTFGFTDESSPGAPAPTCEDGGQGTVNDAFGAVILPVDLTEHTFTARYFDELDFNGVVALDTDELAYRTASTTWTLGGEAQLRILSPVDSSPDVGRIVGTASTITMRVDDQDANRNPNVKETISVKVKSTSDPTGGVTITLTELVENGGVFAGTFRLTTGSTSGNQLQVADRDFILAIYEDAVGPDGRSQLIRSQHVVWREPSTASIEVSHPHPARWADPNELQNRRPEYFYNQVPGVAQPIAMREPDGTYTTSREDVSTIIFDRNEDGRFSTVNDAYIQFRNGVGSPRANCANDRADVIVDYDGTGGSQAPVVIPLPSTFAGDDEVVSRSACSPNPLFFFNSLGSSTSDLAVVAQIIIDLNQETTATPPSRSEDLYVEFENKIDNHLMGAGANSINVDSRFGPRMRIDVDGAAVATHSPRVFEDYRHRAAGLSVWDTDGRAWEMDGEDEVTLDEVSTIVLHTIEDCGGRSESNAFIQFIDNNGDPAPSLTATKVLYDPDGTLGTQAAQEFTLGDAPPLALLQAGSATPATRVTDVGAVVVGTSDTAGRPTNFFAEFRDNSVALVPTGALASARVAVDVDGSNGGAGSQATNLVRAPCTEVRVIVDDPDVNDPRIQESVTVQVRRTVPIGGNAHSITLTLKEAGVDSGTFTGTFRFVDTGQFTSTSRLDVGAFTSGSQAFHIQYTDSISPQGTNQVRNTGDVLFRKEQTSNQVARIELQGDHGIDVRDRLTMPGRGNPLCCGTRDYTLVTYLPIGLGSVNVQVSSTRCTGDKPITLRDDWPGGIIDGRYEGTIRFASMNPTDSCTEDLQPGIGDPPNDPGTVGVEQTGSTITIRVGVAGKPTQAFTVPGGHAIEAMTQDRTAVSTERPFVGSGLPVYIETTDRDDNFYSLAREVHEIEASSATDPDGFALFGIEPTADSGIFQSSFGFIEDGPTDPSKLLLHVESDLQGEWAVFPESKRTEKRLLDGVQVCFLCSSNNIVVTRFAWFDGRPADVRVSGNSFGGQGAVTVDIFDGDTFTNRRFAEQHEMADGQTNFRLEVPFVPGSERVMDDRVDIVPGPSTDHTVESHPEAAEPITDRDRDGLTICSGDATLRPTGPALAYGCGGVIPETGRIVTNGNFAESSATYRYRLAPTGGATAFEYFILDDQELRLGRSLDNAAASGELTDEILHVDYTPATITGLVATSPTDSVTFSVTWNVNTGSYRGEIPVELVLIPNNNRLHVQNVNTAITVRFDDPTMPFGLPAPSDVNHMDAVFGRGVWAPGTTGLLSVHSADYSTTLTQQSEAFGPGLAVQVSDKDADRTPFRDALMIRASHGGTSVNVMLRETLPTSAIFRGIVPVGTAGGLQVPSGGPIQLTYLDPFDVTGKPAPVTTNIAKWVPAQTAAIELHRDSLRTQGLGHHGVVTGADGGFFLRVTDADANRDPGGFDEILVRVVSDGDPVGEVIAISEKQDDPNSGVFVSSRIRFETTNVPGNGRVYVNDFFISNTDGQRGDSIQVIYDDPLNADGRRKPARTADNLIHWQPTFDGAVTLEADTYVGEFGEIGQPGARAQAFVTVSEGDCNKNANAIEIIQAANPLTNCKPGAGFDFKAGVLLSGGGLVEDVVPARFVETGPNTGVFLGFFSFTTGVKVNSGDIPRTSVAHEDRVRAQFRDTTPSSGNPRVFSQEATWFQLGFGVLDLDRAGYNDIADRPIISLLDADLDTNTASANTVTVTVRSQASGGTTLNVQLTETGLSTGFFRGSFGLTEGTTGSGSIKVDDFDELEVTYVDADPAGTRSATAQIGIGEVTPPVTTVVTVPAAPDGLRGVFITAPSVTFEADKPVAETFYRLNDVGVFVPADAAIILDEGANALEFFSEDLFGNEETAKQTTIEVDLTPPGTVPQNVTGIPAKAGSVTLGWSSVPGANDPFEFFEYAVYRDAGGTPIGTSTTTNFTDTTLSDENPHTYSVAVVDKSGREGQKSTTVSVTPDATLPQISGGAVNPRQFDTRENPNNLTVSVVAIDAHLDRVTASLVAPGDDVLATVEMAPATNGTANGFAGVLDVSGVDQPCTCQLVFKAFDVATNEANLSLAYTVTGPDTQLPRIVFDVRTDGQVLKDSLIRVTVTDNVAVGGVAYQVDGGAFETIPVGAQGQPVVTFDVPTVGLSLGNHTLGVLANDTATNLAGELVPNTASNITEFILVLQIVGPGEPIPGVGIPSTLFLPTTARPRADGSIEVSWQVSAAVEAFGIQGFQVWRASSPFEQVHRSTDPTQRNHVDETTTEGTAYRYVATFYTATLGPYDSLADVPGYPGSDEQVAASGPVTAGEAGGLPGWIWVIIIALAILAVAALVAIAIASRRGSAPAQRQETRQVPPPGETTDAEDEEAVDAEAEGAGMVPGETHRLKCPECQHRFEVHGSKPIVTNCPNCGRKGILR